MSPTERIAHTGAEGTADSAKLDVLRSVAVACVVIHHLFTFVFGIRYFGPFDSFSIGLGGVLIFFVHTTLVLLRSMARSDKCGFHLFVDFYIRRIFRIFPLSVFTVLVAIMFRIPIMPKLSYHWIGWKGVTDNLLLIQNVTHSASVIGPLWTLPFEVQMYLALPFVFIALAQKARIAGLLWAGAISFELILQRAHFEQLAGVFLYAPCFLAGALAFNPRPRLRTSWIWPVALALIGGTFTLIPRNEDTVMLSNMSAWLVCGALGWALPLFPEVSNPAVKYASKHIARYSYGVYLSHVPIMWLCFIAGSSLSRSLQWFSFFILLLTVPIGLFHWVEEPTINGGKYLARLTDKHKLCGISVV